MEIKDNPYSTPIDGSNSDPGSFLPDSAPQGFPRPLALAAIGLILAIVVIASIPLSLIGDSEVPKFIFALALPAFQLAWVVFTRARTQQYQETWSPGTRGFVHSVWVLNVLLLCVDAIFAFYLVAAFVATH